MRRQQPSGYEAPLSTVGNGVSQLLLQPKQVRHLHHAHLVRLSGAIFAENRAQLKGLKALKSSNPTSRMEVSAAVMAFAAIPSEPRLHDRHAMHHLVDFYVFLC